MFNILYSSKSNAACDTSEQMLKLKYTFESSLWVHSLCFKNCHHPHAPHHQHHHHLHPRHLWSHVAWDKWGLYFKWQRPILNLTLIDNHKCNAVHCSSSVKITVKRSTVLCAVQPDTVPSTEQHGAKYSATQRQVQCNSGHSSFQLLYLSRPIVRGS